MLGSWAGSLQQAREAASAAAREAAGTLHSAREAAEQQARALGQTASTFESTMLFPGEEPAPARRAASAGRGGGERKDAVHAPQSLPHEASADAGVLRAAILACLPHANELDQASQSLASRLTSEFKRLREAAERSDPDAALELEFARSQIEQLKAKLAAAHRKGEGESELVLQSSRERRRVQELEETLVQREGELQASCEELRRVQQALEKAEHSETELKQ